MAKNIVILCDGTGNEIGVTISNVLKLFRIAEKSEDQRVWYNAGVGTIGQQNPWTRFTQKARAVFGLATGLGLDDHVLAAYYFLCSNYREGDKVYLFGFSRGAYTVRALAAFVHVMGVIRPDQLNIAGYAWTAFKRASAKDKRRATPQLSRAADPQHADDLGSTSQADDAATIAPEHRKLNPLEQAWHFSRVIGGRSIAIEFVGVWDTVASVIVPNTEQLSFSLQTLRFTRTNPSVKRFRQAMAIDEKRRMFRLNAWGEPQDFHSNPFDRAGDIAQDIKQVWFAGVHADIGGGYKELGSGLSKYPLAWMIEEAVGAGLRVNRAMINHLVYGEPRAGSAHQYEAPNVEGNFHRSLTWGWWPLEVLPKSARWRETRKWAVLGMYIPFGERRFIAGGSFVHQSAEDRRHSKVRYAPANWPDRPQLVPENRPRPTRRKSDRRT